ncbi:hypothetical protein ACE6H2_011802 [Prunus campanulata]
MDKDNLEASRLKNDDLIGVKEVLEQCLEQRLPQHISLDRFYFFNMFNKIFDEFGAVIDYDQFVDKLMTHPFLLSHRVRLEYEFTLGSAKETVDICGEYGQDEFVEYLITDASLSTFQNSIQLIENLRTLASNYQGELTEEIYVLSAKTLLHPYRGLVWLARKLQRLWGHFGFRRLPFRARKKTD